MSAPSEIAIDPDVLDGLIADGDVQEGMYRERPDGRFNLRLGGELRQRLDRLVVATGLDYSEVLRRIRQLAKTRQAPPLHSGLSLNREER